MKELDLNSFFDQLAVADKWADIVGLDDDHPFELDFDEE